MKDINNLKDLNQLALEEGDAPTLSDCLKKVEKLLEEIRYFEIKCFLSEDDDGLDILL